MRTETKIGLVFTVGLATIALVGASAYLWTQRQFEALQQVVRSHELLDRVDLVLSLLKDAEAGQRDFLLTGQEKYLEPGTAASGLVQQTLSALEALTIDDPAQQASVQRIRQLADAKLEHLAEIIQLKRTLGARPAVGVVRIDQGKRIMEELRALAAEMKSREQELVSARIASSKALAGRTFWMLSLLMTLPMLIFAVMGVWLVGTVRFVVRAPDPRTARRSRADIAIPYIAAVVLVAGAWVVRMAGELVGPLPRFVTFYPAVLLAAIIGGGGPGIVATILSALILYSFYLERVGQNAVVRPSDLLGFAIFVGTNLAICLVLERLKRIRWVEAVSAAQEQELALLDLGNILCLDTDHRITRWSEGCRRLYGFDAHEAHGRLADELLQTHGSQSQEQIHAELFENGLWEGELTRRQKNGAELVLSLIWALRRDDRGKPAAILEVDTDVTRQRRAEAAAQQQLEQLARQNHELEVRGEEIRRLNLELTQRGDLLQRLMESARLPDGEQVVMRDICAAAVNMFGSDVSAALVCETQDGRLGLRAEVGLAPASATAEHFSLDNAFLEAVIAEGRIADLANLVLHRGISLPHSRSGECFQAALAVAMRGDEGPLGAVVVLSTRKHDWTEIELALAKWLAARCSRVLRNLRIRNEFAQQAALIDLTPDAIIVRRLDGTITFWSQGAETIYEWKKEQAIGQSIHRLLQAQYPVALEEIVEHLKRTGRWSGELIHRSKDGRRIVVQSRWMPRFDEEGEILELLETNVDITERKSMEESLLQTALELSRSNAELEQFAYVASHDLQEPLRMVASYLELLAQRYKGQLDERADMYINFAVDGAERMKNLIEDLLSFSRVTSTKKPLAPIDAQSALDEARLNLRTTITQSEAVVTHGRLPSILADRGQLVQLFQNLIGNAVKFRGDKVPRIHVAAERTGDDWVFSVRDSGIGIAPEHGERIFQIFQRLHTRDEYPGTGMGLAICKKVVERHGGRIWVESNAGEGSNFLFTLPARGTEPK